MVKENKEQMKFSEANEILEINFAMPASTRLLLAIFGLFPLITPYELLYVIKWTDWRNTPFFFAAIISVGALAISALLFYCAVAGLEQTISVHALSRTLIYTRRAPIYPTRSVTVSFDAVQHIDVVTHTWSDGPDSYSLEVFVKYGRRFSTTSIKSQEDIERYVARVRQYVFGASV